MATMKTTTTTTITTMKAITTILSMPANTINTMIINSLPLLLFYFSVPLASPSQLLFPTILSSSSAPLNYSTCRPLSPQSLLTLSLWCQFSVCCTAYQALTDTILTSLLPCNIF
jgi:hypothetical protein